MSQLSETVARGFIHAYRNFGARVGTLSDKLSEEQFWTKPFSHGNSFGHLTLHITGNLNYYIGAQIAKTGYVRDRDREFIEEFPPSKDVVLNRLDEAVDLVVQTIQAQTAETWLEDYDAAGAGDLAKNRFSIVLRCAAHFDHHLGQMIYLERELSKLNAAATILRN